MLANPRRRRACQINPFGLIDNSTPFYMIWLWELKVILLETIVGFFIETEKPENLTFLLVYIDDSFIPFSEIVQGLEFFEKAIEALFVRIDHYFLKNVSSFKK